jgi:hypothetical protein
MKYRLLSFLCMILFAINVQSQITISNAYFPVKGDTLKYFTDDSPTNFDLSVQGGNQTWDFSSLVKGNPSQQAFGNAKDCDVDNLFSDAELCFKNDGINVFFNIKPTAFEIIGVQGNINQGLPIPNSSRYKPARIERRAPMKFFDVNNTSYNQLFSFSTAILPDTLLGQLGSLLDSIRFKLAASRIDVVDGWGKVTIPGGTFDVLREKRTEVVETKIEAHTLFGWVDISTIIGGGGNGGGILDGVGKDTTTTFNFFNDKIKEEIAVVEVDNVTGEVQNVRFKAIGSPTSTNNISTSLPAITISPNPVVDQATISFKNFKSGKYKVEYISVATGKAIAEEINFSSNEFSIDVDIKSLPKGMTLCNVYTKDGKKVAMQKFIVL